MFKKFITASLALTLTAAAAGCGGSTAARQDSASAVMPAAAAAPSANQNSLPALQDKSTDRYFPQYPIPGRQPVYCRKKQVASFLPSNLNLPTAPLITAAFRVCCGQREVRSGYKPSLKTKLANISDYDVIFLVCLSGGQLWLRLWQPSFRL